MSFHIFVFKNRFPDPERISNATLQSKIFRFLFHFKLSVFGAERLFRKDFYKFKSYILKNLKDQLFRSKMALGSSRLRQRSRKKTKRRRQSRRSNERETASRTVWGVGNWGRARRERSESTKPPLKPRGRRRLGGRWLLLQVREIGSNLLSEFFFWNNNWMAFCSFEWTRNIPFKIRSLLKSGFFESPCSFLYQYYSIRKFEKLSKTFLERSVFTNTISLSWKVKKIDF